MEFVTSTTDCGRSCNIAFGSPPEPSVDKIGVVGTSSGTLWIRRLSNWKVIDKRLGEGNEGVGTLEGGRLQYYRS